MQSSPDLADFLSSRTVGLRWDAARRLMASKSLSPVATGAEFGAAFDSLADAAQAGDALDRLLAVDLLVRMSASAKVLQRRAAKLLSDVLRNPLPPVWIASEAAALPLGAKPAEVRENVAQALAHASGEWVSPYIVQSLAHEDRSQRCRVELCRQLLAREAHVGEWLRALVREPWQEILPDSAPLDGRLTRLRDVACALTEVVRANRTAVGLASEDGIALAALARGIARVPPREVPGSRLADAASEVVRLLDEMIAAEFTLATEPQTYEVLETIQGWWRPYPFAKELAAELAHLERRLRSAIALRARMGQRSDSLAARLGQALGPGARLSEVLATIADGSVGLSGEIDDWLRGRVRVSSATAKAASALLGATATGDFVAAFAPLLLDCAEAGGSPLGRDPGLLRIRSRVDAIASDLRLAVAGGVGELVEYNPVAHVTADGMAPSEPQVRIVRPMVVRGSAGGGAKIIIRAVVAPASK